MIFFLKIIFKKKKNKILVWIIVLKNDFCKKIANSIYIILIKFNSSLKKNIFLVINK